MHHIFPHSIFRTTRSLNGTSIAFVVIVLFSFTRPAPNVVAESPAFRAARVPVAVNHVVGLAETASGVVVLGSAVNGSPVVSTYNAQNRSLETLPITLTGGTSALGINRAEDVFFNDGAFGAVYNRSAGYTRLPAIEGFTGAILTGFNDSSQVVGYGTGFSSLLAIITSRERGVALNEFIVDDIEVSAASAISESGDIVGVSSGPGGIRGVIARRLPGGAGYLAQPVYAGSVNFTPISINQRGFVIGVERFPNQLNSLYVLPGGIEAFPFPAATFEHVEGTFVFEVRALSESSDVVGTARRSGQSFAAIYSPNDQTYRRLDDLVDPGAATLAKALFMGRSGSAIIAEGSAADSCQVSGEPCRYLLTKICRADIDNDGLISVGDLLLFVERFLVGDTRADWNGQGGITIQDLLGYLTSFFNANSMLGRC